MKQITLNEKKLNFYLFGIILILGVALCYVITLNNKGMKDQDELISKTVSGSISVKNEITRYVKRSFDHTKALAAQPELIQALTQRDPALLTSLANRYMTNSSEADIISFFDEKGVLLAINSCDYLGKPIDPVRLARIMKRDFADRPIVSHCLTNTIDKATLEFQTHCDFTPALFDSSGLSVAMSSVVLDDTGKKIGVVSTRLNFERILKLVAVHQLSGGKGVIYLVSDQGDYFSDEINSGKINAPISKEKVRSLVEPLASGKTNHMFFAEDKAYLNILGMDMDETLKNGNMYILVKVSKE